MNKKAIILFCLVLFAGIVLRAGSVYWNQYIHGDVAQYSVASESLAQRGDLLIDAETTKPHFYSLSEKGGRFLEHNPLWSLLGGAIVLLTGVSGYMALKILSLATGIFLLIILYCLGKKIGGTRLGLFVLTLGSFSYLLIDFSGNGALYVFQALLYLFFILLILRRELRYHALMVGALLGLGVLLNQQTIILWVSYVILMFYYCRGNRREASWRVVQSTLVMLLFFLPWMVRNYIFAGTPVIPIDMAYVWGKLGVAKIISGNVISYNVSLLTLWNLVKRIATFWFPHNVYFIHRKLFLLAPVLYVFSLLLSVEFFDCERRKRICHSAVLPLFVVAILHTVLSSVWPVAKFRYVVPLLPLVFLLGGYYLFFVVRKGWLRGSFTIASIAGIIILSVLTYGGTPSHTYYYDGVLTTDNFGKQGEWEFITQQHIIEQ